MTKRQLAYKTTVYAVKHPHARRAGIRVARPAAKVSWKVAKPIVKRRVRKRVAPVAEAMGAVGEAVGTAGEVVRTAGALVATYGPLLAIELGLIELPKPKRTAPRVAVGVLIGAVAMYFLDPGHGSERRQKVVGAVT